MNVYDIRKQCEGPLCYRQFEVLDRFLNQVLERMSMASRERASE